jgi:hypothetical protein
LNRRWQEELPLMPKEVAWHILDKVAALLAVCPLTIMSGRQCRMDSRWRSFRHPFYLEVNRRLVLTELRQASVDLQAPGPPARRRGWLS